MHEHANTNGAPVPTDSLDKVVFRSVVDRHGVKLDALAARSNLHASYISRIRAGQYHPTATVFRALWEMTRDADLLEYIAPADEIVQVPLLVGGETDPMIALHAALSEFINGAPSDQHEIRIDTAINALVLYRRRLGQGDAPLSTHPLNGDLSA